MDEVDDDKSLEVEGAKLVVDVIVGEAVGMTVHEEPAAMRSNTKLFDKFDSPPRI